MDFLNLRDTWIDFREEGLTQIEKAPLLDQERGRFLDPSISLDHYGWVRGWTNEPDWLNYGFIYNYEFIEKNCKACPKSYQALQQYVDLKNVVMLGFSLLKPGAEIPTHIDDELSNGNFETLHLTLSAPEGCTLQVMTQTISHREGQVLKFKDIYPHSAKNAGDRDRLILYAKVRVS